MSYLSCAVGVRTNVNSWHLNSLIPSIVFVRPSSSLPSTTADSVLFQDSVYGQDDPGKLFNSWNIVSIAIGAWKYTSKHTSRKATHLTANQCVLICFRSGVS